MELLDKWCKPNELMILISEFIDTAQLRQTIKHCIGWWWNAGPSENH